MIRVQAEDFDVGAELQRLTGDRLDVGGVCSFIGLVRDFSDGQAMELEHYPGMTEKQLEAIEAEARERWTLDRTLIIHRVGKLAPGDRIVLVAATSAHRDAAFEACRFLIDYLKTKAPFWKKEGAGWVEAKDADDQAAKRWQTD